MSEDENAPVSSMDWTSNDQTTVPVGPPVDQTLDDHQPNQLPSAGNYIEKMLMDKFEPAAQDPATASDSETSGISELTTSGSEAVRGYFPSGPSSVTSDFEEDPLSQSDSFDSKPDCTLDSKGTLGEVNLRDLASKIGNEYGALGIYLKFTSAEMDGFKDAHHYLADRIFHMLVTWTQKTSRPEVEDLASALQKCGRTDLAEEITGMECIFGPAMHHTPNAAYKSLLVEFVNQVKSEDDRAKVTLLIQQDQITGAGVPFPYGDQPMSTFQIVQCLQKYNYLGPYNVWYFQYILHKLGKRDLERQLWEYANRRFQRHKKTLHLHKTECVKVNNHMVVMFKLVGDASHFGSIKDEEFKQMLADNFQEEIHYINTVGVQDGCVELYIRLRNKCVEKIRKAANENHECLIQNGVQEVTILGEENEVIKIAKQEGSDEALLSKNAQLFVALLEDNKVQAKQLLEEGANPNMKLGGKPIIHWAVYLDKEHFVKLLLQFDADRNQKDVHGWTAKELANALEQCCHNLAFYWNAKGIIQKYTSTKPPNGHTSDLAATAAIPKCLQGPTCQIRRQFECEPCGRIWNVHLTAEENPVSRCHKCRIERKAVPLKNEYKRSKYFCRQCEQECLIYDYGGVRKLCKNCRIPLVPARNGERRRSSSLHRQAIRNVLKQRQKSREENWGKY